MDVLVQRALNVGKIHLSIILAPLRPIAKESNPIRNNGTPKLQPVGSVFLSFSPIGGSNQKMVLPQGRC